MSVQAMTAVFSHSRLGGTSRLVMLSIANYHGDDAAWPSVDSLAHDCRMSRRAVQDCLRRCEDSGELHVDPNGGPRGTNRYSFHLAGVGCRICTGADVRREPAPEPKEPLVTGSLDVPSTSHSPTDEAFEDQFKTFYAAYPRKAQRGAARRAFKTASKKADLETIMLGLKRCVEGEWSRRSPDKIPYPATWLNGEGWDDEGVESEMERAARLLAERRGDDGSYS